MKKLLSLLLLVTLIFTSVFAQGSSDDGVDNSLDNVLSRGTFILGLDDSFPPMGYRDESGEIVGFDIDVAREVCSRLGVELVCQPVDWNAKEQELATGNIDCIWNGFTMNGREDEYTWSDPYLDNQQVFVVRSDSGIESEEDLAGKIVDVQTESSAQAALDDNPELADTFGTLQVIPDYDTGFMELESGAVDAVAMDIVVASYQIESRGADFTILDESIATEEYGIGFAKGNEALRDTVQATLEEMAADGTMAEISEKWFGEDITTIGK